jgi:hypothetical protein
MKNKGGRPKGSKNIKLFNAEIVAVRLGIDPIEVLLRAANGDWKGLGYEAECYFTEKADGAVKMNYVISPEMRLSAAAQAARYLYSTKQAVEVSGGEKAIQIEIVDYTSKNEKND